MGIIVRRNERSLAIELISEINLLLSRLDLRIKKAGGESTLSVNKKSMFPDVLLYADESQSRILQGWELKLPDVLITDEAFIMDAARKAKALSLNSFFLWNFTYGKLYIRDASGEYNIARTWSGTSHIRTREDVVTCKKDWLPIIQEIILELNEYFINGRITSSPITDVLADNLMAALIDRNKVLSAENYRREAAASMVMESKLKVWWGNFKVDYILDEPDMYQAYAKTVLMNWVNRLLFANIIKRYHNCGKLIETVKADMSPEKANAVIEQITMAGDFYHVFQKPDYNDLLPEETWMDLVDFNRFLVENGISDIDQTVLQDLLEKTVSISKREIRGQYTTPEWLADFLCQITIDNWNGICADPCSGTGTIAKVVIRNKRIRLQNLGRALMTTWVSEKSSYPLQVSNIALTTMEAVNVPLNLFQSDAFELKSGKEIIIKNPMDGTDLRFSYPMLDAITSNLPFVSSNYIDQDEKEYLAKIAGEVQGNTGLKALSGKSDIYMYLPFHFHELLDDKGRLGIILSNSWLGTEAGSRFFNALTYYYDIKSILLSSKGRWFYNADVVATILIMEKKEITAPDDGQVINFWLSSLEPENLPGEDYEKIIGSIVLGEELIRNLIMKRSYTLKQIRDIQSMGISLNALFHEIGWVDRISSLLIPISDLFYVRRGERRGQNALFYPKGEHGIEGEYLKPVLKSPEHLKGYRADTDLLAFCCHKSREELLAAGHWGALRWIEKFESLTNGTGNPLPKVLQKAGHYWYEMEDSAKADFVTALNPNRRLFVAAFKEPTFVDQRFTRLIIRDRTVNPDLAHALLNSAYGMFSIEAMGFGRALGALDASSTNFGRLYMINPRLIGSKDEEEILTLFERIKQREVMDTMEELQDPAREAFDRKVLASIGMEEYYEVIKASLISMQQMRLSVLDK